MNPATNEDRYQKKSNLATTTTTTWISSDENFFS